VEDSEKVRGIVSPKTPAAAPAMPTARYKSHPFGLSLSKPCPFSREEGQPFDKLRANGKSIAIRVSLLARQIRAGAVEAEGESGLATSHTLRCSAAFTPAIGFATAGADARLNVWGT